MNKKVIVATLGIAAFSSSIFCSAFAEQDPNQTHFTVTVNPYLNVTLSSHEVHLQVTPSSGGTFGSTSFTATSSTNNALGYSLNLAIKDTDTEQAVLTTNLTSDTINVNDGTKPVIPTFSTDDVLTTEQFRTTSSTDHLNHWAMSINTATDTAIGYKKALSESTINQSDGPIADDVTTINLATNLNLLVPQGSYSAYFNFEIVANVDNSSKGTEGGSIGEDGGGNAGRVFPANSLLRAFELAYNGAGKSIYVEDANATEVPGWRPMTDADQTTIGGKEVRFAMQDITMTFEENSVTHGVCEWAQPSTVDNSYIDTALVMDIRDGTSYNIVKAADGRCWLADNLALDLTDSTTLNNMNETNTNADATALGYLKGTTVRNASTDPNSGYATSGVSNWVSSFSFSDPLINTGSKSVIPTSYEGTDDPLKALAEAGGWKVGIYYNYCAASAGSYCYGNGTGGYIYGSSNALPLDREGTAIDAEYDICPSGWRMPTGGSLTDSSIGSYADEYQVLSNTISGYTGNSDISSEPAYSVFRAILRIPLSGQIGGRSTDGGTVQQQGQRGHFWSSTMYNVSMTTLTADTSIKSAVRSGSYQQMGYSVRCINKNN